MKLSGRYPGKEWVMVLSIEKSYSDDFVSNLSLNFYDCAMLYDALASMTFLFL
jgi:hypothetical protein